ncbi:sensor histidine kinase [Dactylosporangium aurantiacum]|uniref:sensor histidine kinase n=1 Tax=Dactylosporangium aurantiacum TaxID=35754 RepID=UPI000524B0CD|nr:ATP-binding protein [Dactylosporangium aurantiacum]MDG6104746.1 ATP-binding protein [Dactylosporangium aurantiacum]
MNPTTWSLWRRIIALCAVVAGLLGLIAVSATITAGANRADTTKVMDRLTPALVNTEVLYSQLLRQQTSARTYLLTGRDSDLDAYRAAQQTETEVIADLERLLADEPDLLTAVHDIAAATSRYRREVTEPLIAQTRSDGPSAERATPTDASRAVYTAASDRINALRTGVSTRRDVVAKQVRSTGNTLILLLVFAGIVIIGAGAALALLLRRLVTRPVVDLAAEVRIVAAGNYDHEITGGGPPELSALAADVDTMRRRINTELRDVVEARRLVEEANRMLEQQAAELTRSNRDLEQFAYVASHDLQEPLRKVASFCQLLQRRYARQLDERADQYIAFAVDGAQRMQRLINDLLAFSRIGRLTSGFTDVDLNKVVLDAAEQFESQRQSTGADITFTGLPVVRGEEPLLGALFSNLIGNALKFRHPDRTPRIVVSSTRVDDEYEISVQDNGIGIEPEFADKVFVIFQRLHAKDAYPGTGIGLAIAKKIVEYHGGRIWIDPSPAEGTLFRFTLPVPALDAPPAPLLEESVQ